jgi:CubicO group peptidase (beta-lactamase class C family)
MIMRNIVAIALFIVLAWVAPLRAQTPSSTADRQLAAKVDTIAGQVLESTGVPSASVAVVQNGRLAYAQAYGSARLEPRVAASPEMRYAIGSVSKQFTAVAVLLLEQDGKLSLDQPVSRFLPGLTRAGEVTIGQLLSHTSGYQDFWPQDYVPPMMLKPTSPQGILDQWAKKPLDFEPGTRWQYSNTNYTIAALIVEKVSGMPFFQFVRKRILQPVGLQSAVDFDAGQLTSSDPTGYMRYGLGPLRPAPTEAPGWMYGAGELAMTASDLARWDISLIEQRLLRPATYQALETEVLLKNGVGTGYGLGVDVGLQGGRRVISHSGEVSGFTAYNMVFPDDKAAVVVLTNQDAAPAAGAIGRQIGQLLFTSEDARGESRTARARSIFEGLQKGTIDRSLFTEDANAYFSEEALKDFASSLGPLGPVQQFVQTGQQERGGMLLRVYRAVFPQKTLRVWTFEMSNGKLEQYQVAPSV